MSNRKLPFGYKLLMGEVVIHQAEAAEVKGIFRRYLQEAASLTELADLLREQDVPYDAGRVWNKNMVARILGDERYTGKAGYPQIIEPETLTSAAEKRAARAQDQTPKTNKVMRRLCRQPVTDVVERQVTDLLHTLIQDPALIQAPKRSGSKKPSAIQTELDKALEQQPIDEEVAGQLLLQLIAEQYSMLEDEEYEALRLRRAFEAAQCGEDVSELLKDTVAEIIVERQTVKLRLKNGQIIERRGTV